jgi:catechol 2,3-dioxygenase-like lactoylglutathione lyase family enzyme
MLSRSPVHTTIPASDLERAKAFYAQTLGMGVISEQPGGVFFRSGDTRFLIFPSAGAGTSRSTVMGWEVDDIEAAVADLKGRGVTFEEYEQPDLKTEGSIATFGPVRSAWFKDTEGNILGVVQLTTQP